MTAASADAPMPRSHRSRWRLRSSSCLRGSAALESSRDMCATLRLRERGANLAICQSGQDDHGSGAMTEATHTQFTTETCGAMHPAHSDDGVTQYKCER